MQIDGETVEILTDFILGALRSLQMLTATMKLRHLLLGRKVINHLAAAAKALQSCPTVRPHRRQPTRLRPPWDSPGKNTGVGCHFLLQCMKSEKWKWSHSVVSDTMRPPRQQPTRLLCPWDFPGKSTEVGCPCLLRNHLDNILQSRDITSPTKVCLVKAMVFPVVMYGCESWTIKKAEHQRIDPFELSCWRRQLLRVLWTARRSNQSILKEISPEYSLEGLMLKLKLQYFVHLMGRADSFEKTLMLGKIEGGRRRGWQRMRWLDGITDSMDEFE